jgi:hypothetical protein
MHSNLVWLVSLPLTTLFATALPSWAGIGLPVDEVVNGLKPEVTVPLYVPSNIPIESESKVYWAAKATDSGYRIDLQFTPDCNGSTYCYLGSVAAERGGQFSSKNSARVYRSVQLSNGMKGLYTEFCGMVCQANFEWKINNVLYRVNVKNGQPDAVMGIANSAIAGGVR